MNIGPKVIFKFSNGLIITETVVWSVVISIIIIALAMWSVRRLEKIPKGKQIVAEVVVEFIYKLTTDTMGKKAVTYAPYIGTLFIFLIIGNSLGLVGIRPVTADVNTTFALSAITFVLIQYTAIKNQGCRGKLKELCEPYPFMLPLHLIEQMSFPISLSFRLFGNITGGLIVMELILHGLEAASKALHLPVPLLQAVLPLPGNIFFDIFEPILQAFIFTMLSMVFISREIIIQSAFSEKNH